MTVKATLRIVLKANDVTVAESDDAALWQRTLAGITGGPVPPAPANRDGEEVEDKVHTQQMPATPRISGREDFEWPADALGKFASALKLDVTVVQAACEPTSSPPYLHLDDHAWEAFKRNTGERGQNAIPQIGLAATLLLLWFRHSQSGPPRVTISQAQEVLKTINLRDKNAARGIRNCDWLQLRDDKTVQLNPAKLSVALSRAAAFCSHRPIEEAVSAERE